MIADVLLVDDNAIQAATRKAVLLQAVHGVAVASGGPQALEMLKNDASLSSIGLIITDHCMPGMNGPQLVELLRRSLYRLPIIVLSGLPDAEDEYAGMDVIFRLKPFAPEELISLVRSLLDEPIGRTA
jgi:CheY-like chemotaxis protein